MSVGADKSFDSCHATRQRLLEAAGEVFAELGYREATVREICRRAGANIAAVNYHFRGKEELYAACLDYHLADALAQYPPDMGTTPDSPPEQRLHAFVLSFLLRLLDEGRRAWHGKLLARNMLEVTPFLDTCVEQFVRPMARRLHGIIRELVGPEPSDDEVMRLGFSVVGQVLFYRHSQPVVNRAFPQVKLDRAEIERLADHIARFSLAGIREIAGSGTQAAGQSKEAAGR